jgi:hypothetical protein
MYDLKIQVCGHHGDISRILCVVLLLHQSYSYVNCRLHQSLYRFMKKICSHLNLTLDSIRSNSYQQTKYTFRSNSFRIFFVVCFVFCMAYLNNNYSRCQRCVGEFNLVHTSYPSILLLFLLLTCVSQQQKRLAIFSTSSRCPHTPLFSIVVHYSRLETKLCSIHKMKSHSIAVCIIVCMSITVLTLVSNTHAYAPRLIRKTESGETINIDMHTANALDSALYMLTPVCIKQQHSVNLFSYLLLGILLFVFLFFCSSHVLVCRTRLILHALHVRMVVGVF